MLAILRWIFCACIASIGTATLAQEACSSSQKQSAINSLFKDKEFSIWESMEFDFNGDGVKDLAAVLTHHPKDAGREERLVVLFGKADCKYSSASISSDFCNVRYHYNLEGNRTSLLIKGFPNLRGSYFSMQFRYNGKTDNMELAGETIYDAYNEEGSKFSMRRINYLTGKVISSERAEKKYTERVMSLKNKQTYPLQGFDCLNAIRE